MANQYDISEAQLNKAKWYQERRQQLRHEFQKNATNPFRHATGEGGTLTDPAITRFMAMHASMEENFKATPKTRMFGMVYLIIPMVGFSYFLKRTRDAQEHSYRNGEVAYKDRFNKFI